MNSNVKDLLTKLKKIYKPHSNKFKKSKRKLIDIIKLTYESINTINLPKFYPTYKKEARIQKILINRYLSYGGDHNTFINKFNEIINNYISNFIDDDTSEHDNNINEIFILEEVSNTTPINYVSFDSYTITSS